MHQHVMCLICSGNRNWTSKLHWMHRWRKQKKLLSYNVRGDPRQEEDIHRFPTPQCLVGNDDANGWPWLWIQSTRESCKQNFFFTGWTACWHCQQEWELQVNILSEYSTTNPAQHSCFHTANKQYGAFREPHDTHAGLIGDRLHHMMQSNYTSDN